jgi:protein involved in temperature-dependent protein secretion
MRAVPQKESYTNELALLPKRGCVLQTPELDSQLCHCCPLLSNLHQSWIETPKVPSRASPLPANFRDLQRAAIFDVAAEGIRGGYVSAKQNFPRKTGTAAVRDHGITTRRADGAEPSRCRRTRRG